jgi:hypothetical protein
MHGELPTVLPYVVSGFLGPGAGATGPTGPTGPGATGPGVTGPTGPNGPTGSGLVGPTGATGPNDAFAYFYGISGSGGLPDYAANVVSGGHYPFPNNGPFFSSIVSRVDASGFTVGSSGDYEVSWQLSLSQANQVQVTLDAVRVPYTIAGQDQDHNQNVNSVVVTIAAGQILRIINASDFSSTVTPQAGGGNTVSTSLLISRVS